MQFIIVADKDVASLGRKLAHALSLQKMHEGTLWSVKEYADTEATITSKQAVVFLGGSDVAKSFAEFLPERFSQFGTRCLHEGAKAVLLADPPDRVSAEDIASLAEAVEGQQEEFRKSAEEVEGTDAATEAAGALSDVLGAGLSAAKGVRPRRLRAPPSAALRQLAPDWPSASRWLPPSASVWGSPSSYESLSQGANARRHTESSSTPTSCPGS